MNTAVAYASRRCPADPAQLARLAVASLHAELTPFVRYAPLWLSCGPVLLLIALTTARRGATTNMLEPNNASARRRGWLRVLLAFAGAAAALATSHQWRVLDEMNTEGDYPEVLWQYADALQADGTVLGGKRLTIEESYRDALGCP